MGLLELGCVQIVGAQIEPVSPRLFLLSASAVLALQLFQIEVWFWNIWSVPCGSGAMWASHPTRWGFLRLGVTLFLQAVSISSRLQSSNSPECSTGEFLGLYQALK